MTAIIENQFWFLLGLILIGWAMGGWYLFDLKKKVNALWDSQKAPPGHLSRNFLGRLTKAEMKADEYASRLRVLESISQISVQKLGFLRFNPFQDTGGDQSFILALLDRENNGVILTSLYSREGVRLYAKEVQGGKTKQQLSEEEKKVLEEIRQK